MMKKDIVIDSSTAKFINETAAFLDKVESIVHALMLDMGNQELQRELYQKIRALVKYSKSFKQEKFTAIAQYIQGVLKRLVDGKSVNNQVTTGVLFEGVNVLKGLVNELESGETFLSIEDIIQKLTPTEEDGFLPHVTVREEASDENDKINAEQSLLLSAPIVHDDLFGDLELAADNASAGDGNHADASEVVDVAELVGEYEEALKLTQDSKFLTESLSDVGGQGEAKGGYDDDIINIVTSPTIAEDDISSGVESIAAGWRVDVPPLPRDPLADIQRAILPNGEAAREDTTLESAIIERGVSEISGSAIQNIDIDDSALILSDDKYNREYFNQIAQKYQRAFTYELPPLERGVDSIKKLLRFKINNENETDTQLSNLLGDMSLNQNKLGLISSLISQELGGDSEISHVLETTTKQLRDISDQMLDVVARNNLTPFKVAFGRVPRIVRDYMRTFGREIDFIIDADRVMIDRRIVAKIYEPLLYVIRNSLRFFTEDKQDKIHPRIILSAQTLGDDIVIKLRDNGYGVGIEKVKTKAIATNIITIDEATKLSENTAYGLVFLLGFTLGEDPKEDKLGEMLNKNIVAINGISNFLSSSDTRFKKVPTEDRYTEFQLLLPMLSITTRVLFVDVGEYTMAIPLTNIIDILNVNTQDDLDKIDGKGTVNIGSGKDYAEVPAFNLSEVLGINSSKTVAKSAAPKGSDTEGASVAQAEQAIQDHSLSGEEGVEAIGGGSVGAYIIVASVSRRVALFVNKIVAEDRVVIKSLSAAMGASRGFTGAAITQGGKVKLVINVNDIFDLIPNFPKYTYFRVLDKLSFKRSLKL